MRLVPRFLALAAAAVFMTGAAATLKPKQEKAEAASDPAYYAQFAEGRHVFHAARSGKEALDGNGKTPGNPFATALIETLKSPDASVADFTRRLSELTALESKKFQSVDASPETGADNRVAIPANGARKLALVMVVSDYAKAEGFSTLAGAAYDAERVAAALTAAGFEVTLRLDGDKATLKDTLAAFHEASASADTALIYSTGHGMEVGGVVHLVMGDFRASEGAASLGIRTMTFADIAAAPNARRLNLAFWGGCRNNPLGF